MSVGGTCVVRGAGVGTDDNINVQLADYAGQATLQGKWLWFRARETKQREILATALTALTTGYPVWAEFDNIDFDVREGDIAGNLESINVALPG